MPKHTPKQTTTLPLPQSPDFPVLEEKTLEFWRDTHAFTRSVEMRPTSKQYIFYDGPPFATGLPHYGHLLGSTAKDVIPRYWTMKGYRVERVWGWDCHGLPIENMIEGQLNIKGGKKGIEALGIDVFNQACRSEVLRLDHEWEKIIDRLGRWVDFKNNYKTMDTPFMESVWWGFKQLVEKGLVYQGKKVILYCPRCATPLSNFEIAMDNSYITVHEPSNTYKYKLKNHRKTFILAWSTTPWNKLATPALAVHPLLKYVKVKQGNEYYILAETTLKMLTNTPYTVVESYTGQQLTTEEFELHYDFYPHRSPQEKVGVIIADEFVTAEEGTGVVTLAAYGEDDFRVMQEQGIQQVVHVDDEGKLKPEVTPWAGMFILKANPLINADLKKRGLLYDERPYQHSVPTCYRCSTRLYYAPLPAWFINIQTLKPALLEANESMNWFPKHLKHGRFGKGLATAPDWNISRSRYWGTPMPVWVGYDTQGKPIERIIGSLGELRTWAVIPEEVDNLTDIHREYIDHIQVWVDDNKTIPGTRIPEVFDCWVESGSMPFASRHYPFEHKPEFEKSYPAQFVSEYIAQTRAWFYTMHVMSVGVFGKHAVENTLTTGTILAEDGSKMSKSKKNYPDPMVLINQYGVDSLRLYLMSSAVMKSENLNFSEKEVADIRKNVFLIWWNCLSFYKLYAGNTQLDLDVTPTTTTSIDTWILSRLNTTILEVTKAMDEYNVVTASRTLMQFIQELSTWYVRRSRDQMRNQTKNTASIKVFGYVLVKIAQLYAPFTPFFSELVWHVLVDKNTSIHHTDWPQADTTVIDSKLEDDMKQLRKAVEKAHALRSEAGIKVRQPLPSATVIGIGHPSESLLQVMAEEINVKAVVWKAGTEEMKVVLDTTLTPELKAEGEARELIRTIQQLRKKAGLSLHQTVTVIVPNWPQDWREHIQQVTGSILKKGPDFGIEKVQ